MPLPWAGSRTEWSSSLRQTPHGVNPRSRVCQACARPVSRCWARSSTNEHFPYPTSFIADCSHRQLSLSALNPFPSEVPVNTTKRRLYLAILKVFNLGLKIGRAHV